MRPSTFTESRSILAIKIVVLSFLLALNSLPYVPCDAWTSVAPFQQPALFSPLPISASRTTLAAERQPFSMEPDDIGSFGGDTYNSGNRRKTGSSGGDTNGKVNENLPSPQPFTSSSISTSADSGSTDKGSVKSSYNLGAGKNKPFGQDGDQNEDSTNGSDKDDVTQHWIAPKPLFKPEGPLSDETSSFAPPPPSGSSSATSGTFIKKRKMVAKDQASQQLRGAIWDEEHYGKRGSEPTAATATSSSALNGVKEPKLFYPDIDMSIPSHVYNDTYDAVWELLQWEAHQEAQREPLLVSFLYSTILNHRSLESSLAFLLANRLSSPMLISTQLQSFILEALESSPEFRRALRADMLAVRDRDPACTCLPDVFLYFKGTPG